MSANAIAGDQPYRENDGFKYDVALSFAGEDRNYVEAAYSALTNSGLRVFYYLAEEAELWGKDLYTHLSELYQRSARYTVLFISRHYVQKPWTNHERSSAQARALAENREYILPARFDDTPVPGLAPTIACLDLRKLTPEEFAVIVCKKVFSSAPTQPQPEPRRTPYLRRVSARLMQVFDALRTTQETRDYELSHVAGFLGMDSVGELESYFYSEKEATLGFLDHFADTFGVNSEWLKHGQGQPFHHADPYHLMPEDYHPLIRAFSPETVFFARSTDQEGTTVVVLKLEEWRYFTLPNFWHVSSTVGDTGKAQLISLCHLLKKLQADGQWIRCCQVEESTFDELFHGKAFPGSILEDNRNRSHWCVDLTDVSGRHAPAANYEKMYGPEFIKAQQIIREESCEPTRRSP